MDMEAIKTFINLAKTKSFSVTANQLFVAQSTVSSRIQNLEKELGTTLFVRNNKRVELTNEAYVFLDYAQRIFDLSERACLEMNKTDRFHSSLRIGTTNSIYNGYLSEEIIHYTKHYPQTALKIQISESAHLLEQLCDHIMDCVVVYLPFDKAGCECQLYTSDSLSLVTAGDNTEFAKGIRKKELEQVNYLMCNFALQNVGGFIRGLFPKHFQFGLEIDDCEKVIPFLDILHGYSFLPKKIIEPYLQDGSLREIPLLDFEAPAINLYLVGWKAKKEWWKKLMYQE